MINLRYHIVSITAVFLALAIGVVMGTSFLSRATVLQLRDQISSAEKRIQSTRDENGRLKTALNRQQGREEALARQGPQELFAGRLEGVPVLVMATEGADEASQQMLRDALASSGADFRGTLVVTDRMRLDGDGAAKMSELLGMSSTKRSQVRQVLAARIARALLSAAQPDPGSEQPPGDGSTTTTTGGDTTPDPSSTSVATTTTLAPSRPSTTTTTTTTTTTRKEPELIASLRAGGWLAYQPPEGGSKEDPVLTTGGYRYVVVSGDGVAVPDKDLLMPVLRSMAERGPAPVVLASAATGDDADARRTDVVEPVRSDGDLKSAVTTVDDLEQFGGVAAVMIALDQLGEDVHGHYGVGDGATSFLPPAS